MTTTGQTVHKLPDPKAYTPSTVRVVKAATWEEYWAEVNGAKNWGLFLVIRIPLESEAVEPLWVAYEPFQEVGRFPTIEHAIDTIRDRAPN